MTDIFPIIQVPDMDNIGVNYFHAVFQRPISKVRTRSKVTPISYVCKGTYQNTRCCWADIYYSRLPPTLENGMRS